MEENRSRPGGDGRVTRRGHAMQSVYWNKQPAELLSATAGSSQREKVREREQDRGGGGKKEEGVRWRKNQGKEDSSGPFACNSRCHIKRMRENESLHHHGLEALQRFWSRNLQSKNQKPKGKKEQNNQKKSEKTKLKSKRQNPQQFITGMEKNYRDEETNERYVQTPFPEELC